MSTTTERRSSPKNDNRWQRMDADCPRPGSPHLSAASHFLVITLPNLIKHAGGLRGRYFFLTRMHF